MSGLTYKGAITMLHYQLTLVEARKLMMNGWIDPADFNEHPTMLCRTGDGHATGTRVIARVDCPYCKERIRANEHLKLI